MHLIIDLINKINLSPIEYFWLQILVSKLKLVNFDGILLMVLIPEFSKKGE